MPKGTAVRDMFAGISSRYDLANRLLSGGSDIYWRRQLAAAVSKHTPGVVADLATGSGDVAFVLEHHLDPSVQIHGYDFCEEMLVEARSKKEKRQSRIQFAIGDCLNLPIEDESVDALTISFGLRNLEDRPRGLQEMRRVLKPGGALFILEFSQPYPIIRPFYYLYLKHILPVLARLATGNRSAYDYLAGSIESFPSRQTLTSELQKQQFRDITAKPLTFGVVALHRAIK
jgi:demethylmenaquinone methyltransferase/2-methoxy-6-polyprenyl-1,4-benzoquinol methylase